MIYASHKGGHIMPHLAVKDGTKLYYEEHGAGEIVLFVHGLSSSHFELKPFINSFKGEYLAHEPRTLLNTRRICPRNAVDVP